jgi:hypothetical protein
VTCPSRPNASEVCVAGACNFVCGAGFADCDLSASNGCEAALASTVAHCGACGNRCVAPNGTPSCAGGRCGLAACNTGFADCDANPTNGCEIDLRSNPSHCGACGRVCAGGGTCTNGTCGFGDGSNGPLNATTTLTINTIRASASGTAGSTTLTLSNVVGAFAAGQTVIVHQTQAASGAVGQYEFREIASVSGATVTLTAALTNTYVTDTTRRAQAVVVPQYTTVNVSGTLNAPPWDGNSGGILAFDATDAVTVSGTIDMTGRGFRGRAHGCIYRCGRGYQGESTLGLGGVTIAANGAGGGGGGQGQDDASGGGGGHGAAGANGGNGTCGTCREACPIPGGSAGGVAGGVDLRTAVLFGGAGGEGGADEDGGRPGQGGNGGGIIFVRAGSLTVTGTLNASGVNGEAGQQGACGGVGCGMGGGGGGAGGAVRIETVSAAALGTNRVLVSGGGGGGATCNTISFCQSSDTIRGPCPGTSISSTT